MKVIAFAGSSSKESINKRLVTYATTLIQEADIEILDLNDYELPLFSVDKENILGQPELATNFLQKIGEADMLFISMAEHNNAFSTAYKNLFDWASRQEGKVYQGKPVFLMATSPGARGGLNVLELSKTLMPRYGAAIKATFSLPKFYENFDMENNVISNVAFDEQLKDIIKAL